MDARAKKIIGSLSPKKVIIPLLIGLGAVVVLFLNNDEIDFKQLGVHISEANVIWLVMAFIVLISRDLGYIYRIRHLTSKELSWLSSTYVVILWEFASAITPSVVGGTAIAVFIMNKEKIPLGKSLAYVVLTATLDNLFFVIASLLVLAFVPFEIFPDISDASFQLPVKTLFVISVSLIALYTAIMFWGLMIKPTGFKWLLVKLTNNRLLKRFQKGAAQSGDDMILASEQLQGQQKRYWIKAVLATVFIWSARYLMVNCLIAAFTSIDFLDHLLIFSRQIIMWIVMLISPTPGSAGAAEVTFRLFFGEFFTITGLVLAVAIFWRLFTYYAYLLLGVFLLPRWLRRVFMESGGTTGK